MPVPTKIMVRISQVELSGREIVFLEFPAKEQVSAAKIKRVNAKRSGHPAYSELNLLTLEEPWIVMLKHAFDSALRAYISLMHKQVLANAVISANMFLGLPASKPQPAVRDKSAFMLTAVYYIHPKVIPAGSDAQLRDSSEHPPLNADTRPDAELSPAVSSDLLQVAPAADCENLMVVFEGAFDPEFTPVWSTPNSIITCYFIINQETPRAKEMTDYVKYRM